MFRLGEIRSPKGATHKVKRLGRGAGSGKGDTSGKGHKGLLARKGGGRRIGYEGGQTPMIRRIPKRGFHNFNRQEYCVLNLSRLEALKIKDVSVESLRAAGFLKNSEKYLKILGQGDAKGLGSVKAHVVSASAKQKLEKAGVKVEVIDVRG
jgi:large subunit ribosomal protein L15